MSCIFNPGYIGPDPPCCPESQPLRCSPAPNPKKKEQQSQEQKQEPKQQK